MVDLLRRVVAEPPPGAPIELRLLVKGESLVVGPDVLRRIRRDVLGHQRLNQGRAAAEAQLLGALWRVKPDEIELEREDFDQLVGGLASFTMFCHAWWPALEPREALARLADPALTARLGRGLLTEHDVELLSASLVPLRSTGPGRPVEGPAQPTVSDIALLDELADRLGPLPEPEDTDVPLFLEDGQSVEEVVTTMDRLAGSREVDPFAEPYTTYAHVLVDEAQDLSPMQWRMLGRRGSHASWTIVGDLAQSSWSDPAESRRVLQELIGNAPQREFRMSTNYRSPAEVFELASQVVVAAYPEADLPTAVRSTGVSPELRTAGPTEQLDDAAITATRDALRLVDGTVGVIAAPGRIGRLAELLADELPAGQAPRVVPITPLQSKGLEYDAAVVVAPDEIVAQSPGGVRVLYVALTRPTQRLITVDASADAAWRRSLGSPANGSS